MKKLDRDLDRSSVISSIMASWTEQMHQEYPELAERIDDSGSNEALEKTLDTDYSVE